MRYVGLALCLVLTACSRSASPRGGEPLLPIVPFGPSLFPDTAAGYTRGELRRYAPGMKNYSIAYDRYGPDLDNAATLYFYEMKSGLPELFRLEKRAIVMSHPGAALLREGDTTLIKNGVSYKAKMAKYSFRGQLARREMQLFSQVIVVAHPKRFIKLRSSAPIAQASTAELRNWQLLEAIEWAW